MIVCAECGRESPDGFRFCGACGAPLGTEASASEARKTVTVFFSDLTGSTTLGERLDPEIVRRVVSRYFDETRAVLERHGGTVEKFIGDAVMAVFGIPVSREDDALRAVRAAVEMREALARLNRELEAEWDVRLQTRTGVNTGEVVAGDPATGQPLVTGDAVNVAARLEQAAEAGEILIGPDTYRFVRDAVEAEPVEPLTLKGKGAPVQAWRLVGIVAGAAAVSRRLDSPILGRDRELALLQSEFDRVAAERACRLVTVIGPAGIGKSRLANELVARVAREACVVRGRCLPYGEGITFWPIAEAVKDVAGVTEADPVEAARAKIASLLPAEPDSALVRDRVAAAVGLTRESVAAEELFWGVRKFFEALAAERPLVAVFDDIHWAEPTFLDLLEYLVGWSVDTSMLLLCSARQELVDVRPTWVSGTANATVVPLHPLAEDDSAQLVENLLGQAQLAEEARARIAEVAEGNPLFVEELLRMLIDDGLLRRENGRWVPLVDLTEIAIPPTIQALLAARLDRLGTEERAVIERASVVGKVFWWGAVTELSPEDERPRIGGHLQTLVRKEFIRSDRASFAGEDAFRFGHILIRDAAYRGLAKQARAALHERFAGWLERKAGERADEYEEILGHHLEQAYRYRGELGPIDEHAARLAASAARKLLAAGRRALDRGDMPAAAKLLDRARVLLPPDARRLEAALDLAECLEAIGELGRADSLLEETGRAAAQAGDRRLQARASIQRHRYGVSDPEEVRRVAGEAIPIFEELGDDLALARTYRQVAFSHYEVGRTTGVDELLERALVHARRAGSEREEDVLLGALAAWALWGPLHAEEALRRCEGLLRQVRGKQGEAGCLTRIAGLKAMLGDFDEARELVARSRAISRELGDTYSIAHRTDVAAIIEMLAGNPGAAERELCASSRVLESMGEKGFLTEQTCLLAEAVYCQGRYEEAEQLTRAAEERSPRHDRPARAAWQTVRAKILARRGEFGEAEPMARDAARVYVNAESIFSLLHHGDALMNLAEVLQLAGRQQEAAPVVEQALECYGRKGITPSAERARVLISAEGRLDTRRRC